MYIGKLGRYWSRFANNPLFNTSRFALTTTEVEQPGTTYFTKADNLYFINVWRQHGEDTLHTNTVRDFANRERFAIGVRITALNNRTGENLDTLFVTLANFNVHVHRIAGTKHGDVGTPLGVVGFH